MSWNSLNSCTPRSSESKKVVMMKTMLALLWRESPRTAKVLKRPQITKLMWPCQISRSRYRLAAVLANLPSHTRQMKASCRPTWKVLGKPRETQTKTVSSLLSTSGPTRILVWKTWQAGIDKASFRLKTSNSANFSTSCSPQAWPSWRYRPKRRATCKCWRPTTRTRSESARLSWRSRRGSWRRRRQRKSCTRCRRTTWSSCLCGVWRTCAKR